MSVKRRGKVVHNGDVNVALRRGDDVQDGVDVDAASVGTERRW